jgi:fluoride exporter
VEEFSLFGESGMIPMIVFLGAGLGGVARYLLGGWIQGLASADFPAGTLAINVTGSLLLCVAYAWIDGTGGSAEWKLFLGVGFCGGYTTFSTFSYETVRLFQAGDWASAGGYVAASVIASIGAAVVGLRIGTFLARS